jgi:hypothetical protein
LLREDTDLTNRLARGPLTPVIIRRRIEQESPPGEKVSTSADMPLSSACKAVLAYAAEEAERLAQRHIGTEHLLLGLLREGHSLAAKLLGEAGFDVSKLRDEVGGAAGTSGKPGAGKVDDVVVIHGESFNAKAVRELSIYYRRFHWEKRPWVPRDALVERSNQTLYLYTGQSYDPEQFDLWKGGWNEDHCAICWWKLSLPVLESGEARTNGQDWLCAECHQRFVHPEHPADL